MAALVNTVGAKGSADSSTSLTTSSVTPSGSNTAVLVFTIGESTGYSSGSNFNSSGGTSIDDLVGADVHLNVATNFRQAYGKVFAEVASPTSSTAIYSLFPGAGNSIVVASVFLEDVDQSTPFGTEQVSSETGLSGTQTVSRSFSGLTSGQLVVGALFIQDFAGSASTATANSGTTVEDSITSPGPENDVLTIYVVSTAADGSGNATLSMDATSTAAFSCARMWGVPVNEAAGGGPTYTLDATGGTFSYSGTAAGLVYGRVLAANGGTYAYSGTAAGLLRRFNLAANGGTFTYTGTAAGLVRGRVLAANGGTFTYSGAATTLTMGRRLVADGGTYSFSGPDATLTYSPAGSYSLAADAGSYAYTGGAANLVYGRVLQAAGGVFSYSGQVATLTLFADAVDYTLAAENGAYFYSGGGATLSYSGASDSEVPGVDLSFGSGEVSTKTPKWWAKSGQQDEPEESEPQKAEAKPKREAKKAREQAKQVIEAVAREQVARGDVPKPARFAEVRSQIKPLGREATEFNWPALYERLYAQALTDAIRQEMDRAEAMQVQQLMRQEEEAILLLLAEA